MTELQTERLLLREWRATDFERCAEFYADEEAARFVGGACDRAQAWRRLAMEMGHWALRGYGNWAVEEKSSARLAGGIGLWFPEGWPELELGYWLLRDMHGKGYAIEAALAARAYAYDVLGVTTLVSYVHPENTASIRVAERLGARLEETIELQSFGPHGVYRHPGPGETPG